MCAPDIVFSLTELASRRKLLDGLKQRGFLLTYGLEDTGIYLLALTKGGGYYIGARASLFFVTRLPI